MNRDLSLFNSDSSPLLKGKYLCWRLVSALFLTWFFTPSLLRIMLLRAFGAAIGKGVFIRSGVRVHFPWNLTIGNNSWIGEDAWFINHEKIVIGNNVCISQAAIICSSGHDFMSVALDYKHKPISINDGAWICLRATVLAGSEIGTNSVVSAGEVFSGKLADNHLYVRGAAKPIEIR